MKLVINKKAMFPILFILICFKFMYLVSLPGTLGAASNELIILAAAIIWIIVLSVRYGNKWVINSRECSLIVAIFFVLMLEYFFSVIKYPEEGMVEMFIEIIAFGPLFSYFIFSFYLKRDMEWFLDKIIMVATITAILFCINNFMYNHFGTSILKVYGFNYGVIKSLNRSGNLRIIGSLLIDYVAYAASGIIFQKEIGKNLKKHSIILLLVTIIYNIYVSQTRSTLAILAAVIVVGFLFSKQKKAGKKFIFIIAAFIVAGIALGRIADMLSNYRNDYSIYHRMEEYKYYWNCFIQSPIFGNGLLRDTPATMENYYIVHGPKEYSYVDVGLIGLIAHMGLCGVLLMGSVIAKMLKALKVRKGMNYIVLAMLTAFILSMINLSMFDAGRMGALAFYLALMENSVNLLKEKNKDVYS